MTFEPIKGYKNPTVRTVNANILVATYLPEKKNKFGKSIINIYNNITKSNVQLYSDTLVNICDVFITSMLLNSYNTLPKIKNKKVSKGRKKK